MVREVLTLERLRAMDPAEAAAHFIVRRADGLTEHEEALLAEWLGADEAHERAFARADRAWDLFDGAAGNELLDAMRAHALERRPRRWPVWQQLAAMAAVLLLILGAGWLLMPMAGQHAPASEESAIRYVAARGPVKAIGLPDGSRITLDADSTAIGRFSAARRSIELVRGRAYFEVRPDRTRPFTVDALGQRVTAVGTEFDVALAGQALTVTLLEGRVTIGPPDETPLVTLEPRQQFINRDGKATVRTLGPEVGDSVGWRQGLMDFDDETLADVVAQANRYSRRQIVVRDPQVASMRVSGQFRTGDAERFAAAIAELHPVHVVQRGDTIELVRGK